MNHFDLQSLCLYLAITLFPGQLFATPANPSGSAHPSVFKVSPIILDCGQTFIIEAANGVGGAICPAGAEFGLGVTPGTPSHPYDGQLTIFAGGVSSSISVTCLEDTYGPGIDDLEIYLQSAVVDPEHSDLPCQKTLDVVLSVVDPSREAPASTLNLEIRFSDILPPQLSSPLNQINLPCGNSTALSAPVAFDGCAGPVNGTTSDAVIYSQEGTYTVTWDFDDGCGNTSQYTQQIVVGDPEPPTIDCGAIHPVRNARPGYCYYISDGAEFEPTYSDNCGATLYTAYSQSDNLDGAFFDVGVTPVTWTATDAAGLKASCTVFIEVIDAENPTALCKNITLPLTDFGTGDILAAALDNGSYDHCGIAGLSISKAHFDCSDIGPNTVTLTVTDINGNSSTCESTVTITGDEDCEVTDCANGLNLQGLPCGWTSSSSGIACADGNKSSYNTTTKTFTLQADGCYSANASADESGFISYDLCGNGQITAHVAGLTLPGFAGIVMRESTNPGAKKVALVYSGSTILQRFVRFTNNGASYPSLIPTPGSRWLRIVRNGNLFKGYHSLNGTNWSIAFTVTVPMQSCIKIGLIAYGPNGNSSVTASFDQVSVVPTNPMKTNPATSAPTYPAQDGLMLWPNPATGENAAILVDGRWSAVSTGSTNVSTGSTNVSTGSTNVSTGSTNVTVEVMDNLGRLVKSIQADVAEEQVIHLGLKGQQPGVYFVRVSNTEGRMTTLRLVLTDNG